ncbi:MAG: hypothetical protein ACRC6T_08060 [Sarcina sp.]
MSKEDYFRKLIIVSKDIIDDISIEKIFNSLTSWNYIGIENHKGVQYYVVNNTSIGAKVHFVRNSDNYLLSTNVLAVTPNVNENTIYSDGCDYSKNQEGSISKDILFALCKELNTIDRVFCGIVPATVD